MTSLLLNIAVSPGNIYTYNAHFMEIQLKIVLGAVC